MIESAFVFNLSERKILWKMGFSEEVSDAEAEKLLNDIIKVKDADPQFFENMTEIYSRGKLCVLSRIPDLKLLIVSIGSPEGKKIEYSKNTERLHRDIEKVVKYYMFKK